MANVSRYKHGLKTVAIQRETYALVQELVKTLAKKTRKLGIGVPTIRSVMDLAVLELASKHGVKMPKEFQ